MTTVDRTDATDEEFRARFDRFGIFDEERVVEEVARAIATGWAERFPNDNEPWEHLSDEARDDYRAEARDAAAAVAAYRAQDDGAEGGYRLTADEKAAALTSAAALRSRLRATQDGDLRTPMADVADNLDYYAGKTDGGTYAGGLADAAGQIRAVLGGAQDGGAEEAVRRVSALAADMESAPRGEIMPVSGAALLIREALNPQADR